MFHTHKNQQKIYANQQALEVAYYLLILIIESYITLLRGNHLHLSLKKEEKGRNFKPKWLVQNKSEEATKYFFI